MSVLVTGGTGCLGCHLLNLFTKAKGELISYSLDDPKPYRKVKNVIYYQGDLQDEKRILEVLKTHKPTEVYHSAAQNSVGLSQHRPVQTLQVNMIGTQILLECLRKIVPKSKVGIISSSEVYGGGPGVVGMVHTEKDPTSPLTPFATSKAGCELLARQHINAYGMNIFILRPFHFTGPLQSIQYVLPAVAKQIAEIELFDGELAIYAGNLDISRDYIDVRDLARAIILLFHSGKSGEVYNVCSGKARTIRNLVEMMIELTGKPMDIRIDPNLERAVDLPMLVGSPQKVMDLTGWKPIISIEDSLKDLYFEMKTRVKNSRKKNLNLD